MDNRRLTPRSRAVWSTLLRSATLRPSPAIAQALGVSAGKASSMLGGRSHVTVEQARLVLEHVGVKTRAVGRNGFTIVGR